MKTKPQLEKALCDALAGSFTATVVDFNAAMAARVGLHETDFKLVSTLASAGGSLNPKELGARHHMSTAATTLAVDRLEKAGLAKRVPDASDGRRVFVQLLSAPQFERRLGASLDTLVTSMAEVTSGFTAAELGVALRFLTEAREVLVRMTTDLRA